MYIRWSNKSLQSAVVVILHQPSWCKMYICWSNHLVTSFFSTINHLRITIFDCTICGEICGFASKMQNHHSLSVHKRSLCNEYTWYTTVVFALKSVVKSLQWFVWSTLFLLYNEKLVFDLRWWPCDLLFLHLRCTTNHLWWLVVHQRCKKKPLQPLQPLVFDREVTRLYRL